MIKHIVMFKFKDFGNYEEKLQHAKSIKEALDALPAIIPEIRFYETGINIADSPRAFDMVLTSHFDSLEELDKYRIAPEHIKVLEMIKKVTSQTIVVDY